LILIALFGEVFVPFFKTASLLQTSCEDVGLFPPSWDQTPFDFLIRIFLLDILGTLPYFYSDCVSPPLPFVGEGTFCRLRFV